MDLFDVIIYYLFLDGQDFFSKYDDKMTINIQAIRQKKRIRKKK